MSMYSAVQSPLSMFDVPRLCCVLWGGGGGGGGGEWEQRCVLVVCGVLCVP